MRCQRKNDRTSGILLQHIVVMCYFFFLAAACQPHGRLKAIEEESAGTLERYCAHLCEKEKLEKATRSLWDEVSGQLDARLPTNMPSDERRNMIEIRNTNLIKMFEVYPTLDTSVKALVEKAGDADNAIVVKLRQVQQALEEEELRFIMLLDKLEKMNTSRARQWKSRLEEAKKAPCAMD
jgi:hypothetical protein